jgi:hypothetical protein
MGGEILMSESGMRMNLVKTLSVLDAISVENPAGPGTPDINFIGGWIECKWLRAWPKRPDTPVKLDHPLLPTQKAWLKRRCRRGGKAWVMLQCGREWFLFDGIVAANHLGIVPQNELRYLAHQIWNQLDTLQLIQVLMGN